MILTAIRTSAVRVSILPRAPRVTAPKLSTMPRTYTLDTFLVTPKQLNEAMSKNVHSKLSTAPRVLPLCGSWFLPNDPSGRTGYQTFLESRIPHARFFDLDKAKDPNSPYPHMLPSPEDFAKAMGKVGIRRDDTVVVYDTKELGIFSAPRVAWTLKVFGHKEVHILNNFRLWVEEGYPLEHGGGKKPTEEDYPIPDFEKERVITFEELSERVRERGLEGAEETQILDARSKGRFDGREPEPRPGLPSGHMPGSTSVPVGDLLDPKTKAFLSAEELKEVFKAKGVDVSKPIVSSCGTGVTAAVIDAALAEAGYPEASRRLYDGSWTEWAQRVRGRDHLIESVVSA